MQEYLYHKNNQRVLDQQDKNHQALKALYKKKSTEDASLRSSFTRSMSIDGEVLPNIEGLKLGGYGSNT